METGYSNEPTILKMGPSLIEIISSDRSKRLMKLISWHESTPDDVHYFLANPEDTKWTEVTKEKYYS